jgi:DNA (cytosine-5)-methyltransferase 1
MKKWAFYNEKDPKAAEWIRELIKAGIIASGIVDERSIEDVVPAELAEFSQCHWFAGIGVWSYALRRAGWPDDLPVWTGSAPCQPFSAAGKGEGFADERHLWPAWFHLIEVCRPDTIFGEQVSSADGTTWLDLVHSDLEGIGYRIGTLDIPSASVGAPHRRQRLYFVADTDSGQSRGRHREASGARQEIRIRPSAYFEYGGQSGGVDNAANARCDDAREHECGQSLQAARLEQSGADGVVLGDTINTRLQGHWGLEQVAIQKGWQGAQRHGSEAGSTNGFWSDAEWIYCRDGKYRPTESKYVAVANGSTGDLGNMRTPSNGENQKSEEKVNAETAGTGPNQTLCGLPETAFETEIQRQAGRYDAIPETEVLQSAMYGEGSDGSYQAFNPAQQPVSGQQANQGRLRALRSERVGNSAICPSQRRESVEQCPEQFADLMRLLPSSYSLAELCGDSDTTEALSALLKACGQSQIVQHTSDEAAEIWRSLTDESKSWINLCFTEGRVVRSCEFPLASGIPGRVGLLRGYGNAINGEQAKTFIESYLEVVTDSATRAERK